MSKHQVEKKIGKYASNVLTEKKIELKQQRKRKKSLVWFTPVHTAGERVFILQISFKYRIAELKRQDICYSKFCWFKASASSSSIYEVGRRKTNTFHPRLPFSSTVHHVTWYSITILFYFHRDRIPCNQTRLERGRDNRRAALTGRLSYQELCDGTGGSLCSPCSTVSLHRILSLYSTPGVNGGRQNLRPTPRTHTRKKQQQCCNNCHFVTSIFTIKFPSHMR